MENIDEMKNNSWYERAKLAAEEELKPGDRIFGIVMIVFSFLAILYFIAHQSILTGFFTSRFTIVELFLFYGFWVMWMIIATLESVLRSQMCLKEIIVWYFFLIS
jgi:hypothetical protein